MGFPGIIKKQGLDFNYFSKVTVTWSSFGGGASDGYGCDLVIPFSTQYGGILLLNEDSSSVVAVSYNGSTQHDELNPSLPSKGICYDNRTVSLIWFKLISGSSAVVSIRAW